MQHLPPHPDPVQVRCYASIRVYRPEECSKYQSKTEEHLLGIGSCGIHDTNVLLHEWYFSLLAKVTACEVDSAIFHSQCVITEEEVLSTEHLGSHLVSWTERIRAARESSNADTYIKLFLDAGQALLAAKKFYAKYLSRAGYEPLEPGEVQRDSANRLQEIDPALALSFAVLGETLQYSLGMLHKLFPDHSPGWSFVGVESGWGYSPFLTKKMKADGWSSLDIQRFQMTKGDVSALYYTSTTTRARTSSEPANETSHTKECGGKCQLGKIDPKEIARVTRNGDIPLVVFTAANTPEMKVYKLRSGMKYTAISHAWNNFLGSTSSKGLPKCRLNQFQKAVNRLHMSRNSIPFFVDCLCIPQQLPARREALQRMNIVYEMATNTLVFAPEVLDQKKNTHLFEIATRVSNSKWSTRLWTLQEAVLSKNLYFQGDDCQFSAKELHTKYATVKDSPNDPYYFVQKAGRLVKPTRGSLEAAAEHNSNFVADIWKAMQWREATDPLDEAICLARMLNLDTKELVDIRFSEGKGNKDRASRMMAVFLDLLDKAQGIPPGFIFLPGERLASRQYGWALRTWLTKYQQGHPRPLEPEYPTTSYLTSSGLQVQYPGLDILGPGKSFEQSEFWLMVSTSLQKWFRIKYVKDIDTSETEFQQALTEKSVSIIMTNSEPGDIPEVGILVQRLKERQTYQCQAETGKARLQSIRYVKYLCRVEVVLEDNLKTIQRLRDNFLKNSQDTILGKRADVATHWVVGGTDEPQIATESPR
ncbi:hypothetical protein MMC10_001683 [Thelotrema lepadinum]|nr:hypothetical protein [Thelotrema lepadinum]